MKCRNAPQGGVSETLAAQRRSPTQCTSTDRHNLALARAHHLSIVTSATASGVLEPTERVLDATAGLAGALAFDLWLEGA